MTNIREHAIKQNPDYEWVYLLIDHFTVSGEGSLHYNPHHLLQMVANIKKDAR